MKTASSKERILWGLAIVFMLLGTAALLRTVLHARTTIDGLYGKHERIRHLALLKYEADGMRSAVMTLERDTSSRPTHINELIRTYLEHSTVKTTMLEPEQTGYGWLVQRAELQFDHLDWEEISVFLKKAEEQRPPWRIKHMSLTPGDDRGLSGKLLLHAVQKSEI